MTLKRDRPAANAQATAPQRHAQPEQKEKMMSKKTILVAIDGSYYSDTVVDKAIEYCRQVEGKILLVYCHRQLSSIIGQPARDREIPIVTKESRELIEPYLQRLQAADIPVEDRLMEEPAGAAITDIATIEKCDLIIMGSRGLSNLASLIVGSVTNRVLQTAPCSVLVVK
jgi:nucleotide-binding universal stress UspA family protein